MIHGVRKKRRRLHRVELYHSLNDGMLGMLGKGTFLQPQLFCDEAGKGWTLSIEVMDHC